MSVLALAHYNPLLSIVIATDVSDFGISAAMLNKFPDCSQKEVATCTVH